MMKPIFNMIYNEMYIYIWLIAFYNLFIMIIVLAMFFILCKLLRSYEIKRSILAQFELPVR